MPVSASASVISMSRVAWSTAAKASSVGAKTVNSPPFRVSTRFTPGSSWPLTTARSRRLHPDVNLVATLNGGEFTVFAPTDEAFAAVDQATLDMLMTDADALTGILTYH